MNQQRPPRRELVAEMIGASRLLQAYIDTRARKHGTTRAQWSVLARLRRREEISQTELATDLSLRPISLVRLIDDLAERGFVERRLNPKDRRANLLHLTSEGRAFVDGLDPVREEIASTVLAPFDDRRVLELVDAFQVLIRHLNTDVLQRSADPEPTSNR